MSGDFVVFAFIVLAIVLIGLVVAYRRMPRN
jgi:hypothetical protein